MKKEEWYWFGIKNKWFKGGTNLLPENAYEANMLSVWHTNNSKKDNVFIFAIVAMFITIMITGTFFFSQPCEFTFKGGTTGVFDVNKGLLEQYEPFDSLTITSAEGEVNVKVSNCFALAGSKGLDFRYW